MDVCPFGFFLQVADHTGDGIVATFNAVKEFIGGHTERTATEGGKLDHGVGGGYLNTVVPADLAQETLNVQICAFLLLGIDHTEVIMLGFGAYTALDSIAVEDNN